MEIKTLEQFLQKKVNVLLAVLAVALFLAVVFIPAGLAYAGAGIDTLIKSERTIMLVNTDEYCALNWAPATSARPGYWVVYPVGQGKDKVFLYEGDSLHRALAVFARCK